MYVLFLEIASLCCGSQNRYILDTSNLMWCPYCHIKIVFRDKLRYCTLRIIIKKRSQIYYLKLQLRLPEPCRIKYGRKFTVNIYFISWDNVNIPNYQYLLLPLQYTENHVKNSLKTCVYWENCRLLIYRRCRHVIHTNTNANMVTRMTLE